MRATCGEPRLPARLARALGVDRNPLRRTIDRAEAWIRTGLLVAFLADGPMAAMAAARATAQAVDPVTGAQPHAVQAVLLRPATAPAALRFPMLAALAWVAALTAVGYGLWFALRQVQRFLDWRRLAAWEAAWHAIGPQWTGDRS